MAGCKRTPIADRFWSKVLKTDGCWLWQRHMNNKGYGCFWTYDRSCHRSMMTYAHRFAWTLTRGPIPDGMNVLHKCDTPACVNPDHLFVGTQMANVADCIRKGRWAHGERFAKSKLTAEDVRAIRKDKRTQNQIAAAYGIHQMTVSDAKRRKTWKHVD